MKEDKKCNDLVSLNKVKKSLEIKKLLQNSKVNLEQSNKKEIEILKKKEEIEKLKEEIKVLEFPSIIAFKSLEEKQKTKRLNQKSKDELLNISRKIGLDHEENELKNDVICDIKKMQSNLKLERKIKSKRGKDIIPSYN